MFHHQFPFQHPIHHSFLLSFGYTGNCKPFSFCNILSLEQDGNRQENNFNHRLKPGCYVLGQSFFGLWNLKQFSGSGLFPGPLPLVHQFAHFFWLHFSFVLNCLLKNQYLHCCLSQHFFLLLFLIHLARSLSLPLPRSASVMVFIRFFIPDSLFIWLSLYPKIVYNRSYIDYYY